MTDDTQDLVSPLPQFASGASADQPLTDEVPGTGGVIKARCEDFLVEELPLYDPCGEGEHLYLFVEKRNLSTTALIGLLAAHFGVKRHTIGYAGLKDRYAITRQLVSIHLPGRDAAEVGALTDERVSVLWAERHTNKLRTGHLIGNRFVIRIRDVAPTGAIAAKKVLGRLEREGAPNRFGAQRFGTLVNNHIVGRSLILGRWREALDLLLGPNQAAPESETDAREAYAAGDFQRALEATRPDRRAEVAMLRGLVRGLGFRRCVRSMGELAWRFHVTAFQSALFNAVLDRRLADGTYSTLLEGDLAFKHDNGAVFGVDAEALGDPKTSERLGSMTISPTGPLVGPDMPPPSGRTLEIEQEVLSGAGMCADQIDAYASKERWARSMGRRRPLRIGVTNIDVEGGVDEHGTYVRCAFELPKGAFATSVMEEIIKPGDRPMTLWRNEAAAAAGEEPE